MFYDNLFDTLAKDIEMKVANINNTNFGYKLPPQRVVKKTDIAYDFWPELANKSYKSGVFEKFKSILEALKQVNDDRIIALDCEPSIQNKTNCFTLNCYKNLEEVGYNRENKTRKNYTSLIDSVMLPESFDDSKVCAVLFTMVKDFLHGQNKYVENTKNLSNEEIESVLSNFRADV